MNPEAALKSVVAGCRKAFTAVGLFSLAINLLMLIVPLYMMQMYDRVISSGNVNTLVLLSIIAVAGLLAMSLVEMMRSRIMVRLGSWVDRSLSGPVLSGGMNDSLRAAGLTGANGLRELSTLRGFLTGAGVFPLLDAPWVPIFVAIIFIIHPILGMIAVAGAVIVFIFALLNDISTRQPLKQAGGAVSKALYRADAMVRNADVAAAMGMEPHLVRRWRESNEEGLKLQALASDRAGAISAAAKFVRLVLQIAMLGVGAYLVTQGQLTGGGMIAGSIILSRAMAPIEQSIGAWRGMVGAKNAYESIKTLLRRTPATGEAMNLPRPSGQMSIEGVAFVPPGAVEPVLRGVSLEIQPGECVGLIGSSASGKTTLARVLVGSWRPSAGHARMDGADVFIWDAADRGRYIGYLPQDVELFDGPIRENIARMGQPDTDQVIAAAQLAGVHELILRLPQGYETIIGDGGTRLSGGQRQRIALARALYGDPALVVLDEPNSNLDTEGERALMEAMTELKRRGVTTIVVAHRPTVLASVDRLVVMHQGRVEMQGPRDEVLGKVAPGSLDAVRRAALAEPAPDSGPSAAPAAAPPSVDPAAPAGPVPTMPTAAPAPQGAPVFRIRPGAASQQASAPAPAPERQPEAPVAADPAPDAVEDVTDVAPPRRRQTRMPATETVVDVKPEPQPTLRPAADEDNLKTLFSKITAEGQRPARREPAGGTPAAAAPGAKPVATPAPAASASVVAEPPPPSNWPIAKHVTKVRERRPLRQSPTAPGRLETAPTLALTGEARPRAFTPRYARKEA